jgi:hypothetical protein
MKKIAITIKKLIHSLIIRIISTAIAIIIVTIIIKLEYFEILMPYIRAFTELIILPITMPIWAIILAIVSALTSPFLIKRLYSCTQNRRFLSYREDEIDSVLWRWNYHSSSKDEYIISDLTPHCPKCKFELCLDKHEYYSCINHECEKFNDKYGYKKEKDDIIRIIKQKIEKENPHFYKKVKLLTE